MLGLAHSVRGCLFDLDGVLTQTANVHAAAWKEMFDAYLRRHAEQTKTAFVPFDPLRGLLHLCRRQAPRRRDAILSAVPGFTGANMQTTVRSVTAAADRYKGCR